MPCSSGPINSLGAKGLHGQLSCTADTSEESQRDKLNGTNRFLGNGRNTVSRVLFRRRELTEPH